MSRLRSCAPHAALVCVALTAAGPSAAQTPAPLVRPVYHRMTGQAARIPGPSGYVPIGAHGLNLNGDVTIQCRLMASGDLTECLVLDEAPRHRGFGDAALAMARDRHMTAKPRLENGKPVDGETVRVKVVFDDDPSRF